LVNAGKKELGEFEFQKAKLAWHYGWTDEYIESLTKGVFYSYYQAITHIEAEKLATQSRISLLGFQKKEVVKKWTGFLEGLKFKSKSSRKVTIHDLAVSISKGEQDG